MSGSVFCLVQVVLVRLSVCNTEYTKVVQVREGEEDGDVRYYVCAYSVQENSVSEHDRSGTCTGTSRRLRNDYLYCMRCRPPFLIAQFF